MSVIFVLIPLSIVFAACFLGAFIWAVRSGQYEDTCTPSMRVLLDEPNVVAMSPSPLNGGRAGVRGGNDESVGKFESSGPNHPSPSIPLPVEGRGKNISARSAWLDAADFGRVLNHSVSKHS